MAYLQVRNKTAITSLLSHSTRTFMLILGLNGMANSLSNIFINVFLFKVTQNLYDVALFNFVSYVIWMPFYLRAS
ncbi:hypothetical protein NDK43_10555 [Neobacillus pocheonensis]|uniref:MFS transporter n=1 Tax=Neobacillus pocheonensis TaxID=363869 RepID=A0ABT0W8T7_9BACI|nr:hypothetical protein [Neobacillus pocheonensis]